MYFIVHEDAFTRLGEETEFGTIPLRAAGSRRELFLKNTAAALLACPEERLDFAALTAGKSEAEVRDLEDGLILLECFGIAEVFENPREEEKSVRVAGEKDYRGIASFLAANRKQCYGSYYVTDESYVNEDGIRMRQFNNNEYNILSFKDGAIEAVMLTGMPRNYNMENNFRLAWVVLADDVPEAEIDDIIMKLLDYACEKLGREFSCFRYLSIGEDERLLSVLLRYGFKKKAFLKKETIDGRDVTVYDYRLREGDSNDLHG